MRETKMKSDLFTPTPIMQKKLKEAHQRRNNEDIKQIFGANKPNTRLENRKRSVHTHARNTKETTKTSFANAEAFFILELLLHLT